MLNSVYRKLKSKNGGIGTPEMRFSSVNRQMTGLLTTCQVAVAHGIGHDTAYRSTPLRLDG